MKESWASTPTSRRVMQGNRSRDTKPELTLRHELFKLGLRYYVQYRPLPSVQGKIDIAFPRIKLAVFVDGCFWHGCIAHYKPSKSNTEYWDAKIAGNVQRDRQITQLLQSSGWTVMRVWSHEDATVAALAIKEAVSIRRLWVEHSGI